MASFKNLRTAIAIFLLRSPDQLMMTRMAASSRVAAHSTKTSSLDAAPHPDASRMLAGHCALRRHRLAQGILRLVLQITFRSGRVASRVGRRKRAIQGSCVGG